MEQRLIRMLESESHWHPIVRQINRHYLKTALAHFCKRFTVVLLLFVSEPASGFVGQSMVQSVSATPHGTNCSLFCLFVCKTFSHGITIFH